jgi:hypothetical protein
MLDAAALGEITPGEAQTLAAIIHGSPKGLETADWEPRIAALEKERL